MRDDVRVAAGLLGEGLASWRGAAFDGVESDGSVRAESVRLDEVRLAAMEDWFEARLALGDHRAVASELEVSVAAQPMRERLWSLLMQALYYSGRQADALQAYQRARHVLLEELGIEPGAELKAVESAVLGQRLGSTTSGVRAPATLYARNEEGLQIGYSTVGTGSDDVVFLGDIYMNLELLWDVTELGAMFEGLLPGRRLLSVQRRGIGVSDREHDGRLAPPQDCIGDIDSVLEAVGVEQRVSLLGWGHGGQVAIAYAAAMPERVSRVVIVNGYARLSATADYDTGYSQAYLDAWLAVVADKWGRNVSAVPLFGQAGDDPALITRLARLERLTASPRDAVALHRALNDFDVRDSLQSVASPVLVVYLKESISGQASARWLAEHLPSAQYVELPGHFVPTAHEAASLGATIDAFLQHPSTT